MMLCYVNYAVAVMKYMKVILITVLNHSLSLVSSLLSTYTHSQRSMHMDCTHTHTVHIHVLYCEYCQPAVNTNIVHILLVSQTVALCPLLCYMQCNKQHRVHVQCTHNIVDTVSKPNQYNVYHYTTPQCTVYHTFNKPNRCIVSTVATQNTTQTTDTLGTVMHMYKRMHYVCHSKGQGLWPAIVGHYSVVCMCTAHGHQLLP